MRSIIIAHIFALLCFTLALMPFWIMAADAMRVCQQTHSYDTCVTTLR